MRFYYGRFIPYLLVVVFLFLSSHVQEKIAVRVQESKLTIRSFFSKKASAKREQRELQASVQRVESACEDACLFHDCLDDFSPWVLAEVVSHKEAPWSHTAWIDIGSSTKDVPFPITPNCPVVYGKSVVGIVEQVGEKASLIRMLSDPLLRPSVQVLRDGRDSEVERSVIFLQQQLESNPSLMPKETHRMALSKLLLELRSSFPLGKKLLLAKGELQGSLSSKRPRLLRGLGFNYDMADAQGPSRDIRTGQSDLNEQKIALVRPGDLLVTNGLDGLYPPGLEAAFVTKVLPLEEGGFAYEIEALVSCQTFLDLHHVAILPALPQEIRQESIGLSALLRQIEQELENE